LKNASGDALATFMLAEQNAGSDASNLKVKDIKKNNNYYLSGLKKIVTTGENADLSIAFAITDPKKGKKGISAFITPTNFPEY